jgi:hypothetical protein
MASDAVIASWLARVVTVLTEMSRPMGQCGGAATFTPRLVIQLPPLYSRQSSPSGSRLGKGGCDNKQTNV